MIKSNTKKARENIRAYIDKYFDFDNYDDGTTPAPKTFAEKARFILDTFRAEYRYSWQYYHGDEFAAFCDWCAGLPSVLNTCYFYNREARADVAAILEQTPEQAAKYSEQDAENYLTKLIYNELKKAA